MQFKRVGSFTQRRTTDGRPICHCIPGSKKCTKRHKGRKCKKCECPSKSGIKKWRPRVNYEFQE